MIVSVRCPAVLPVPSFFFSALVRPSRESEPTSRNVVPGWLPGRSPLGTSSTRSIRLQAYTGTAMSQTRTRREHGGQHGEEPADRTLRLGPSGGRRRAVGRRGPRGGAPGGPCGGAAGCVRRTARWRLPVGRCRCPQDCCWTVWLRSGRRGWPPGARRSARTEHVGRQHSGRFGLRRATIVATVQPVQVVVGTRCHACERTSGVPSSPGVARREGRPAAPILAEALARTLFPDRRKAPRVRLRSGRADVSSAAAVRCGPLSSAASG